MANWIASRCDNPSIIDVIDVKFEAKSGQIVSVKIEEFNYCYTLIEPTEQVGKYGADTSYGSCLECLNNSGSVLVFKPCFNGEQLIIPSNVLNFFPQIDKCYKLNLTITIEDRKRGIIININDCYTYSGYVDTKPVGDFKFNSDTKEYKTCEECNPYVGNLKKWGETASKKFDGSRDSYLNNFKE
jgi:hypothetical protein